MAKSKKELDRDLMFEKIMPALSDNPFSDLHGQDEPTPAEPEPAPPKPDSAAPEAPIGTSFAAEASAQEPPLSADEPLSEEDLSEPIDTDDALSALRSRLFSHSTFTLQCTVSTINVMESVVTRSAEAVMRRFNCCSCDRCRCDVITAALNFLPPHYVVGDPAQAAQYDGDIPEKQVTAALVRAVLQVRAHPNH